MRMIQAADFGSPFAGSFLPMLRTAVDEAARRGWEPHVVLPPRARDRYWLDQLEVEGVEVSFAPESGRSGVGEWLAEMVAADSRPTVIHTHFSAFDVPAAAVARRNPHVKAFWHVHTRLGTELRVRVRNRVRLSLYARWVERILCVAPHLVDGMRKRGAPAGKLLLFRNALDVDAYAPASVERRGEARSQLGLPPDGLVLLHHGRDWELKGGDLLLRSLQVLREGWRDDVLVATVRGGEPARRMAEELGVADATVTLDGTPDVPALYSAADLLMATSRAEGLPLAVLEALASGIPVVATDIPGHSLPADELPGLRIVPLEPGALASAARELLEREAARAAADAEVARTWIRERMSLERWGRRLLDLFEEAVAPGSP